jgi:cell division protein FtsB
MKILVTALLVSLLVILQYDLWIGEGSLTSAWRLEDHIEEQRAENDRLQLRNDALTAEVSDLKSGLSAIEERARSELGMIKQGETFVQIIDQENAEDN